jgi:prepilin-type N-terminal cleavage/methylation domain-containing protein
VTSRRAFTLLEAVVALAVLAIGVVALERLLVRSIAGVGADVAASRAMMSARALLTEAEVRAPETGHTAGVDAGGLRFERDVLPTAHPGLRAVTVRVHPADGGPPCELVELIRVPAA